VTQRTIGVPLRKADAYYIYYIHQDPQALAKSGEAKATEWINRLSGVLSIRMLRALGRTFQAPGRPAGRLIT